MSSVGQEAMSHQLGQVHLQLFAKGSLLYPISTKRVTKEGLFITVPSHQITHSIPALLAAAPQGAHAGFGEGKAWLQTILLFTALC